MKKVLLATTALVATAGFAAAEISLSGSASMGLQYTENGGANTNDNDTVVNNEIDFDIVASGTSDSGVAFGASVDLDASETDQQDGADQGTGANDPEVYVSYNGFKVTVGAVGGQQQDGTSDVGYQGIGADDLADSADTGDYDVNVSYAISGVSLGVSMGSDSEDTAVSVSGEFSGVSFGLSSTNIEGGNDIVELALGYTMGAVAINATYADVNAVAAADDHTAMGLSVGYTSGAMTFTVVMSDTDVDNQDANYGVGVAYDLGGGLAIKAGYGQLGATTAGGDATAVADLGLTMSF